MMNHFRTLSLFFVLTTVNAAYKCSNCYSPPEKDEKNQVSTTTYCPQNTWTLCLDETAGDWNVADREAQSHVKTVWSLLINHGISPTEKCHVALKKWACAAHMPVCEASTHGRGVCGTQFGEIIEPECPAIFAVNTSIAQYVRQQLDEPINGSVISKDHGSCVPLDYSGPNYWNWIVGFGLCTIFAALSPLALNLQKRSINQNDALPANERKPTYKQTKWLLGCVILISGSLVDFVAYGLAPQSLLTPLGSLVLVWNMVVAHYYGEKIGRTEVLAMFVIFIGTLLCIISADHYTPNYSFSDILNLWYTERMLWYIILVPLLAALHTVPLHYIKKLNLLNDTKYGGLFARIQCICYAGAAGIIGAQAILFAKQTMELLKAMGLGEPIFAHYETYLILLGIPCGLFGNLSFLNAGLRDFDALQVVPIYQTYWMLAGTVGGFVYFDEISEMSDVSKGLFFLGTLISILGIAILSSRAPPVGIERYGKLDVSDELDDDDDENIDLVKIGSSGDDEDDSEDGDIELRIRPRSNSDVVVVQRVAGAFVLTMSDSDGSSPLNSPRLSSSPSKEIFEKYADEPMNDEPINDDSDVKQLNTGDSHISTNTTGYREDSTFDDVDTV